MIGHSTWAPLACFLRSSSSLYWRSMTHTTLCSSPSRSVFSVPVGGDIYWPGIVVIISTLVYLDKVHSEVLKI